MLNHSNDTMPKSAEELAMPKGAGTARLDVANEETCVAESAPEMDELLGSDDGSTAELVFILDRSGSMGGLEADTIGGFNSMIEKQKELSGRARVTTVLFDDKVEVLHDRENLAQLAPLTKKQYWVRGCTALLDAIGTTVKRINRRQKSDFGGRPDRTIVVITTDGLENASHKYTFEKVRALVEKRKEENGWEFIFMGANMDAIKTAAGIGISADRAATYMCDARGTSEVYGAANDFLCCARMSAPGEVTGSAWKSRIEEDFAKRGK